MLCYSTLMRRRMRAQAHRHTSAKPGSAGCLECWRGINFIRLAVSTSQQDLHDQIQSVCPGESLVPKPAAYCFLPLSFTSMLTPEIASSPSPI